MKAERSNGKPEIIGRKETSLTAENAARQGRNPKRSPSYISPATGEQREDILPLRRQDAKFENYFFLCASASLREILRIFCAHRGGISQTQNPLGIAVKDLFH